jgi:hypothetical protein
MEALMIFQYITEEYPSQETSDEISQDNFLEIVAYMVLQSLIKTSK